MDVDPAIPTGTYPASSSGPAPLAPSPSPPPERGDSPPKLAKALGHSKPGSGQEAQTDGNAPPPAAVSAAPSNKRARGSNVPKKPVEAAATSAAASADRVPGTTLLPLARVQKIIKADKEMATTTKEAVFLIAVATEEFIKKLARAGQAQARREGRLTVQQKDLAIAVKQNEGLSFLEDIIPQSMPATTALEKREKKLQQQPQKAPGDEPGEGALAKAFQRGAKGSGKGKGKGKTDGDASGANGSSSNGLLNVDASKAGDGNDGLSDGSGSRLAAKLDRVAVADDEMDES
ncbi:hypothetical protein FRC04_006323 [Tulasnella sp. 424]|nr:hypothetical protein FRC04_006323 [Tulasnella sp. 424]KAG8980375.1 hypothetical protein FRC05_006006 [Tulasnella sp. 425]